MAKKQKKHTQAVKTTHPKNKHENQPAQASQSKSVRPVKKKRGWLLATAIILITLHGILATYLISTYPSSQVYVPRPYILPILIANAFIDVVAGIAMWFWKRWGVILFGISAVISAAIGLVFTGQLMVIFYQMIPFVILGYIIAYQNKRQLFN
jgi:hypothetical protein